MCNFLQEVHLKMQLNSVKLTSEDHFEETNDAPEDYRHLFAILSFMLGFIHFIPISFFVTSNDYWMYKFRNVQSNNSFSTENRTVLQANFFAISSICTIFPMSAGGALTTIYGNKILNARTRILVALIVMSVLFIQGTVFTQINTDSWQLPFFTLTMAMISVIAFANGSSGVSVIGILSNFPYKFTKLYVLGEGFAGSVMALLEIISISIGTTLQSSALIYLVTGTAIIMGTTISFIFGAKMEIYKHYVPSKLNQSQLKRSWTSYKNMIWKIKICTIIMIVLTMDVPYPSITSLVVSQFHGLNNWGTFYFVPVVSFLLTAMSDFFGRNLANFYSFLTEKSLLVLCLSNNLIFIPLIMFCNAQPRSYLPVLFDKDYQYIIMAIVYNLTQGYCFSMCYYLAKKNVQSDQLDLAYSIISTCDGIFSPISLLIVNII